MPKTTVFSQIHSYIYEMTTVSRLFPFYFVALKVRLLVLLRSHKIKLPLLYLLNLQHPVIFLVVKQVLFGSVSFFFHIWWKITDFSEQTHVWKKKLCKIHHRVRRVSIGSNRQFQRRDDDYCKNQNKKNLKRRWSREMVY